MQKNDAWHGAADVEVEEIDWKIITDANAALSSFLAGDLDMVGLGTGELIKQAEAAGATIQSYTDGTSFYIYFNNNDQYLSNVNLRRALFNAIDEQKEIDTVWQNDNEPMTSFTAPVFSLLTAPPLQVRSASCMRRPVTRKRLRNTLQRLSPSSAAR